MATEAPNMLDAAGHGGAEAVGMPQLNMEAWPNQIFWLLVTLAAIYFLLTRTVLPRIGAVLAERRGTITNDLAAAEELKQKAVLAEKAYNEALARARSEAASIVSEARAAIQKDLDLALAEADAEISARSAESEKRIGEIRAGALESVTQVARDTAQEIVTAFGGKSDPSSVDAAVAARMKG